LLRKSAALGAVGDSLSLVSNSRGVLRAVTLALDVDGVLLDPNRGGRGSWQAVLEERFGVSPNELMLGFFDRYWPRIILGELAIEPQLTAALVKLGCNVDFEDVLSCWFETDSHINDEVLAAANRWSAAGARIILATNQEHRRAAYLAEFFHGKLPLDGIAYSADLGYVKSDPAFFEQAAVRFALPRDQRVVLVDDALGNVEAAQRSGWGAVHFSRDSDWCSQVDAALRNGS
jgi:putative hydrolase of the HAD superfamily